MLSTLLSTMLSTMLSTILAMNSCKYSLPTINVNVKQTQRYCRQRFDNSTLDSVHRVHITTTRTDYLSIAGTMV